MVRCLDDRRRGQLVACHQRGLSACFDVAGQQHAVAADGHFQHQRPVVQAQTGRVGRALPARPEQPNLRTATAELPRSMQAIGEIAPRHPVAVENTQERAVLGAPGWLAIPPEFGHIQVLSDSQ